MPFVIDLTKIDFLDSSGLGALVQTEEGLTFLKNWIIGYKI